MNKVLTHLKNNFVIYLIIIACLVVVGITFFFHHEEEIEPLDSSLYYKVDLGGADFLFNDDEPKLLLIGTDTCSATINYAETLNFEMIKYNYKVYYLNYAEIDTSSEKYQEFIQKLNLDYEQDGVKGKFSDFMGMTPMTVIIKNKKMVYGYIGSMNASTLDTITEMYGVSNGVVY